MRKLGERKLGRQLSQKSDSLTTMKTWVRSSEPTWKTDLVTCIVIPVLGIETGGYLGLTPSSPLSGEVQTSERHFSFFGLFKCVQWQCLKANTPCYPLAYTPLRVHMHNFSATLPHTRYHPHTCVYFNTLKHHSLSLCTAITQLSSSFQSQSARQKPGDLERWMSPFVPIRDLSSGLSSFCQQLGGSMLLHFPPTLASSTGKSEFCQPLKHVRKRAEDKLLMFEITEIK